MTIMTMKKLIPSLAALATAATLAACMASGTAKVAVTTSPSPAASTAAATTGGAAVGTTAGSSTAVGAATTGVGLSGAATTGTAMTMPSTAPSTAASAAAPAAAQAGEVAIQIKDYSFQPQEITVKKGSNLTWTQNDDTHHTVWDDANGAAFKSPLLAKGETFKWTANAAGDIHYHCDPHPSMKGTIHVVQ